MRKRLQITHAEWTPRQDPNVLRLRCQDGKGFEIELILKPGADTDWQIDCHYMIIKHFDFGIRDFNPPCVGQWFDFEFQMKKKPKGRRTGFPTSCEKGKDDAT